MDTKHTNTITKLTTTAALSALIIVMGLTRIGLIPWFNGASITIMQIPVIFAVYFAGLFGGLGTGLVFGVFSLIQAAMSPVATDAFFVNPLVSILPRLLMGAITALVYCSLSKIKKFPHTLSYAITALLGSLSNTIFVLLALVITKAIEFKLAIAILISNGLLETLASVIICTAIMQIINLASTKKSQFSDDNDENDSVDAEYSVIDDETKTDKAIEENK